MIVFGTTTFMLFGFLVTVANSEFFSPENTNAYSLFASWLVHVGAVVAAGGMTGLKFVNYSVMPGA